MPDAECQTEKFLVLDKKYMKTYMSYHEREEYKINYMCFKRDERIIKTREYQRKYQKNYHAMKMKYDPIYKKNYIEYYTNYNAEKKQWKIQQRTLKKQLKGAGKDALSDI